MNENGEEVARKYGTSTSQAHLTSAVTGLAVRFCKRNACATAGQPCELSNTTSSGHSTTLPHISVALGFDRRHAESRGMNHGAFCAVGCYVAAFMMPSAFAVAAGDYSESVHGWAS